jgi:hypothetical protein
MTLGSGHTGIPVRIRMSSEILKVCNDGDNERVRQLLQIGVDIEVKDLVSIVQRL